MITGVAFDLDGTLIDDTEMLVAAEVAVFLQKGVAVTRSELMNFGGASIKDIARSIIGDVDDNVIKELRASRKEEVLRHIDLLKVFPDTMPTLQKLKDRGIKISIATGLGRDLLPVFLEKTGISGFIEAAVSVDDVEAGKPAPDVFLRAFELMNVHTAEGLAIGDSRNDMIAAKSAGLKRVLIARNGQPASEADYTISSLEEVIKLL